MSSDKHCCVPGCKDSEGSHKVLHRFPNPDSDIDRFKSWLYAIGSSDMLGLENVKIFRYRRVCQSHFEAKYLCRNYRISNIAVPTLNMSGPLSLRRLPYANSQPLQQFPDLAKPSTSDFSIHCKYLQHNSKNIEKNVIQTENIDPDVLMHEHTVPLVPHTTAATTEQNLGQKRVRNTAKKVFLSKVEPELHKKLLAARIKLSKIKKTLRKQSANIKACPAMLDTLENAAGRRFLCTASKNLMTLISNIQDIIHQTL